MSADRSFPPPPPSPPDELFCNLLSAYGRTMYDKGTLGEPMKRTSLYDDVVALYTRQREEIDQWRRVAESDEDLQLANDQLAALSSHLERLKADSLEPEEAQALIDYIDGDSHTTPQGWFDAAYAKLSRWSAAPERLLRHHHPLR